MNPKLYPWLSAKDNCHPAIRPEVDRLHRRMVQVVPRLVVSKAGHEEMDFRDGFRQGRAIGYHPRFQFFPKTSQHAWVRQFATLPKGPQLLVAPNCYHLNV